MQLLSSWKPGRKTTEQKYQFALLRYLNKKLPPDAYAQPEYPIAGKLGGKQQERFPDIVISDNVLIEMKVHLKHAVKVQRASGQLEEYVSLWNGPIVLLIAGDSDKAHITSLQEKARRLASGRQQPVSVAVV